MLLGERPLSLETAFLEEKVVFISHVTPDELSYSNSDSGMVLSAFPGWTGGSTAEELALVPAASSAASLNSCGAQAL